MSPTSFTSALVSAARPITDFLLHRNKRSYELKYWKGKYAAEGGALKHAHFQQLYTEVFGLSKADYAAMRVLDIGCGPRGSLEWADMARERVGLDPLAVDYLKLGAARHRMYYVAAASEDIPFADGHFDFITTFNSLDHVDDLRKTIAEIKRIARVGGALLLMVEINHPPTPTEPITVRRDVLGAFAPEYTVDKSWACALLRGKHDVYKSVLANTKPSSDGEKAILCALMRRNRENRPAMKYA